MVVPRSIVLVEPGLEQSANDDSPFAADARDGNAKGAKIYFHDAGAAANTITAPGDLNIMFIEAYVGNAGGAA